MQELRDRSVTVGSYIELSSPELLWLGSSGQPYRGTLYIQYITNGKTVEMIDLKKYITSLRQETILLEDIAIHIYSDLVKCLGTDLQVTVKTSPRGGISSTIRYGSNLGDVESKPIVFGVQ